MLDSLEKFAREHYIPVLLDDTKELLIQTIHQVKPKKILEIGTAIGYSGTIMLKNCDAVLTTIDIDENNISIAKNTFKEYCVDERVNQIVGDAKNVLPTLSDKYDFIFLDGPKGQYIYYLPHILKLLNENGVLFADNVLYKGMVKSEEFIPHKKRTIVVNLRKYLESVTNSQIFDTTIYEIGDGVAISKLKTKEIL